MSSSSQRSQQLHSHYLDRYSGSRGRQTNYDIDGDEVHYPTRPVDKDKADQELVVNIKKATSTEESAPKQKHVRSMH